MKSKRPYLSPEQQENAKAYVRISRSGWDASAFFFERKPLISAFPPGALAVRSDFRYFWKGRSNDRTFVNE
ncbi:hypothetical protein C6I21_07395 [Alkalicoccus urumqiensis]|uniref:Uncharacterized protein n=1 Tax=Alkalicoccus urumqiensis TaxID=1548213 RepID=A0A2P6MHF0_ALKUR|nr:hypothetical protein C6I21_07395 [Alkalicoccus urumqiensis]